MSTIDTINRVEQRSPGGNLRRALLVWIGRYDLAEERRRTRRALVELSDEQLRDIGLTRSEANREGRRGFWD